MLNNIDLCAHLFGCTQCPCLACQLHARASNAACWWAHSWTGGSTEKTGCCLLWLTGTPASPVVLGVVQETPVPVSVSNAWVLTLLCTMKLPAALLPFEHTARPAGPAMLPVGAATSVAEAAAVLVLLQPPSLWVAVRLALNPLSGQPAPGRWHVTVTLDPAAAAGRAGGAAVGHAEQRHHVLGAGVGLRLAATADRGRSSTTCGSHRADATSN